MNEKPNETFHGRTIVVVALVALGSVLLIYGISPLWTPLPESALRIENQTQDVGTIAPGAELTLHFALHNVSDYSIRILGTSGGCGKGGCVVTQTELPFDMPPHQSKALTVKFRSVLPGKIAYELPIYTDWPTQNTIHVKITGTVIKEDECGEAGMKHKPSRRCTTCS